MFRAWCMLHIVHLIVKKQLNRMGRLYWSALAKTANVWRSAGSAAKLFRSFAELHGNEAAKLVKNVPPRPLVGRWGSCTNLEAYLLKVGPVMLRTAWSQAFGGAHGRRMRLRQGDIGDLDEQDESYGERMGRYAREALAALTTTELWCDMIAAHTARRPATHFLAWLQKSQDCTETQDGRMLPSMMVLVCEKSTQIADEWNSRLDPARFEEYWGALLETCGDDLDVQAAWIAKAVSSAWKHPQTSRVV